MKNSGQRLYIEMVTISNAEYDRLRAIAKAAQRVVVGAELRNHPEFGRDWLADLTALAVLVPSTRLYSRDPLT